MRKITERMSEAFFAGKPRSSGNTCVAIEKDEVVMYLHGSKILRRNMAGTIIWASAQGFPTNTTKERINGVLSMKGVHIYQKDFIWYIAEMGGAENFFGTGKGKWNRCFSASVVDEFVSRLKSEVV